MIEEAMDYGIDIRMVSGDGVNDAPALKQANVGIAVSSATDAARSASHLVLTTPGLSVIIHAIEEGSRIFERMSVYGWLVIPIGWERALIVWAYAIIWLLLISGVKILTVKSLKKFDINTPQS